jgi:Bacteriocin-protection, YdeI or OmpD-Associated/Domain of unknown function (DUF1905)
MRFRTKILQGGKTATGIEVPPKVVTALGSSKRPAVKVTIKGYTYRSTVATMDGKFMVGVSATVREAAGVAGGDTVGVDIELDTAPREVTVPDDFAKALKKDVAARKLFDGLSYSRKLALVGPINDAKTDETRQRRFDKALAALRDGTA